MGAVKFAFSRDQMFLGANTLYSNGTTGTSLIPSGTLGEGRWFWKSQVSDEWGVWSPWSAVRTLTIDLTNPTVPANIRLTQSPFGENVLTWSPSTDPLSGGVNSVVKGYYVYAGSRPGLFDLVNEQFVSGTQLTLPATSYVPYCMVRAVDNAGNVSDGASDRSVRAAWTYDEAGNRLSQLRNAVETLYAYNDRNELVSLTEGNRTVTFEYDANGNQTKRIDQTPERTETWEYAYDDLNRLVSVKQDAAVLAAYAYDALGRRVKAVQNNKLTVFIYSDISVVYEETYDAPGDPLTALDLDLSTRTPTSTVDYIRGNGQLVAKVTPGTDPTGYLPGEVATDFHLDHLGSTRVQTDQAGNVVAQMDYEPFGGYLEGAQGSEPYSYTGQRNDGDTGLYYYGARFYDPAVGRFITEDPAKDGLNWYAYCENEPLGQSDPLGLDPVGIYDATGDPYGLPNGWMAEAEADDLQTSWAEAGVALDVSDYFQVGCELSAGGLSFIAISEGTVRNAQGMHVLYYDSRHNPTIGYGHLIIPGENLSKLTEDQARALLSKDTQRAQDEVNSLLKRSVPQWQFDALVSFDFQFGRTQTGTATFLRLTNEGYSDRLTLKNFTDWSRRDGPGVYSRMIDTWELFALRDYVRNHWNGK